MSIDNERLVAFEKAKRTKVRCAKLLDLKPNGHGNQATLKKGPQDLLLNKSTDTLGNLSKEIANLLKDKDAKLRI